MRWIDTQVAFPGLLIALIILAVIGPGMLTVILVLSFNGWMVYGRMTRGAVLSVRQTAYVEAAEVDRLQPRTRVVFRHILPNLDIAAADPGHPRVRAHRAGRSGASLSGDGHPAPGDLLGPGRGDRQELPVPGLVAGDLSGDCYLAHRCSPSTSWQAGCG
ncbi:MAG: ABC transporter permease subunit [Desulfobacterales bacterium]|nr:ABC transporter permease subunit [Desulfobacterales bacterium]